MQTQTEPTPETTPTPSPSEAPDAPAAPDTEGAPAAPTTEGLPDPEPPVKNITSFMEGLDILIAAGQAVTPRSREMSLCVTKLEEARHWYLAGRQWA